MPSATLSRSASLRAFTPVAELDDAFVFMRLVWAVNHELERVSKRMETSIGLTIPQRMCLLLIAAQPGILASQIADILHLHRGTLSGILRRLETAGLIIRTADEVDARCSGLTLTPEGVRLKGQRAGTFEKAVRRMLANISAADRLAAEKVLIGLRRELEVVT